MLTTMPQNRHTSTGTFDQTPNAETAAHQLGGRKAGQNDWRLPHICGGAAPGDPLGDNPGLSVGDGDKDLIVFCHYGCDTTPPSAPPSASTTADPRAHPSHPGSAARTAKTICPPTG